MNLLSWIKWLTTEVNQQRLISSKWIKLDETNNGTIVSLSSKAWAAINAYEANNRDTDGDGIPDIFDKTPYGEGGTQCYTIATFVCNNGTWEKGSFALGCAEGQLNNGWVQDGNTVTYTKIDATSLQCFSHGLDTDCSMKLYGTTLQTEAPDSYLDYVNANYACKPENFGVFTISTSNGSHTFYFQEYGQQTYNSGSGDGSRYYYVFFYSGGISFITCEQVNLYATACYAHTVTGNMSQGASGSHSSVLSDCYIPIAGGYVNCSGEPYGHPVTFTWNVNAL